MLFQKARAAAAGSKHCQYACEHSMGAKQKSSSHANGTRLNISQVDVPYHYLSVCCTFRTQRPDMDWMCGLESRIDRHTRPLLNKGSALFLVGCVNGDHLIRIGLARLRRSCILLGEVFQGSGPAKYPMHICSPGPSHSAKQRAQICVRCFASGHKL